MYRQHDAHAKPPTVIEYRSQWVRPLFILLGIVILAGGLWSLVATFHATRITCSRTSDRDSGSCRVRRYALFDALDEVIPASELDALDVRVRKGSKGSTSVDVTLRMTSSSRPDIALERGGWAGTTVERAEFARSELLFFRQGGPSFDEWLSLGPVTSILPTIFGFVLLAIGIAMLREQFGQLWPIRIVVDHVRRVIVVRGQDIPWNEIDDVNVEFGRALFWSSGKSEHVPGHRIVIVRKVGAAVLVTKEFRAGPAAAHEAARRSLLRAMGRATV